MLIADGRSELAERHLRQLGANTGIAKKTILHLSRSGNLACPSMKPRRLLIRRFRGEIGAAVLALATSRRTLKLESRCPQFNSWSKHLLKSGTEVEAGGI